jgi:hypothetical protein
MSTEILMPALSHTTSAVMARLDRAIHPPVRTLSLRTRAATKSWMPAFAGMTMGDM